MNHANLDPVAASIYLLPEQIKDIIKQSKSLNLPKNYRKINHIVVSGMGGSNLAGHIFASLFSSQLASPIIINDDYDIPAWINNQTLFIACSYSGSTEETLAAYKAAKKAKALIVVLSADSKSNPLLKLAKADHYPSLAFTSTENPSNQPRLALGYTIFSLASILNAASQIKLSPITIQLALKKLTTWREQLLPTVTANPARKLAESLTHSDLTLVSGPFLAGNAHALRNQINENSKHRASYLTLPEMNHYALEGLAHPATTKANQTLVFFESSLYSPRLRRRLELTKQVATKNGVNVASHKLSGRNALEQGLEMLQFGAWLSYYLAQANQVDPIKIPWVDWFKKALKKS